MRALIYILLVHLMLFSVGQKKELITYAFDNSRLETVLDSVSSQTSYQFSYNPQILPKGSLFSLSANELPIDQFLSQLLAGTGLRYSFYKNQIILNYEKPDLNSSISKRDFFVLSGTVRDEHGIPLRNVNIFLDGTSIGVYSDIDGNFKLTSIPPGRYNLVFSYVGYQKGVYLVEERKGGSRIQNHQLEVDTEQLEEVEVLSKRINQREGNWASSYEVFKNELLGPTDFGADCTIENPEVISFRFIEETGTIKAFAKEPIQIRNEALGYKITYFLESFVKRSNDLRYRGNLRFSNMQPMSRREAREWRKNRKNSYFGSYNHFKQSLLQDRLRKEGFRIYSIKRLKDYHQRKFEVIETDEILVFKGDHYELDFENFLLVEFRKEKESERFLMESDFAKIVYQDFIEGGELTKLRDNQLSALKLLKGAARLDLNGETMDKFGITSYGYWSWERIGNLVPLNYDPKVDKI